MHSTFRFFINSELLAFSEIKEDFGQLVRSIVIKVNSLGKAALQSRVTVNEVVHLFRISCDDTDELAAIILQTL